ncbi:hypothetical protein GCM10009630_14490 [Kribbella jejuensis]
MGVVNAKKDRYPRITRGWSNAPADVTAEDWVSQPDAAERLGVMVLTIGWLMACGHLDPANGPQGRGITRSSLDRELAWREHATWRSRVARWTKNIVRWI